jgi:hypothetical protein
VGCCPKLPCGEGFCGELIPAKINLCSSVPNSSIQKASNKLPILFNCVSLFINPLILLSPIPATMTVQIESNADEQREQDVTYEQLIQLEHDFVDAEDQIREYRWSQS